MFFKKLKFLTGAILAMTVSTATGAESPENPSVVIVVSNSIDHPSMGFPLGFWAAELTHPYAELQAHNIDVTIASLNGGPVVVDGFSDPRDESKYSEHDFISLGFLSSPKYSKLLESTIAISDISLEDFDAIIVAGGQAPMFTFRENTALQNLILEFYESGKPTAALCHGVAALMDIKRADGTYLIDGKTITGFSKAEDDYVDEAVGAQLFEWWIEPTSVSRGANYVQGGMWANFATNDGNLITGQQQNSGGSVAKLVINQINNK